MEERRPGRLVRGLMVMLFVVQSLGVLAIYLVLTLAFESSDFEGPSAAGRNTALLNLATLAAFVALIGAAVEASGLLEGTRAATRLAVIGPALAVNAFGLLEGARWFVEFATSDGPSTSSAVRSGLIELGGMTLSCAVGSAILALFASRAIRSPPRLAVLVDA